MGLFFLSIRPRRVRYCLVFLFLHSVHIRVDKRVRGSIDGFNPKTRPFLNFTRKNLFLWNSTASEFSKESLSFEILEEKKLESRSRRFRVYIRSVEEEDRLDFWHSNFLRDDKILTNSSSPVPLIFVEFIVFRLYIGSIYRASGGCIYEIYDTEHPELPVEGGGPFRRERRRRNSLIGFRGGTEGGGRFIRSITSGELVVP